jgi:hypothetical protein
VIDVPGRSDQEATHGERLYDEIVKR